MRPRQIGQEYNELESRSCFCKLNLIHNYYL
jgi:hypothetical protein